MSRFLKLIPMLVLLCASGSAYPASGTTELPEPPGHEIWDGLVSRHVYANGMVNYNGFAGDREALDRYIGMLESNPPADAWSREEKLAYYINLYNAATVRLVLDNFPIESIMGIKNPWNRKILTIGGKEYTLNNIEHDILRPMGEPRIHFAINCASASCPVLQPFAFTADGLDKQLNKAAREFINDPKRNKIARAEVELSRIFKWFKEDFTGPSAGLIDYINQFLEEPVSDSARINFLEYDWALNRP